ncbi:helix-turn-helix domain-containing protein [Streptosporangium longisporum]|uniref:HTH hxlR-type domain-containing protein n=1 Tax=Streptosporangium longisporum TaxID=46187 RepID=A0ABN3XTF0_9ACTN
MTREVHVCGVGAAIDIVQGKWKTFLLWTLAERPRRFGETRRLVPGISEKVLTEQLRELETDGIVHREVYDESPPRVEYSLTAKGRGLFEALEVLDVWGRRHLEEDRVSAGVRGAPSPDSLSRAI